MHKGSPVLSRMLTPHWDKFYDGLPYMPVYTLNHACNATCPSAHCCPYLKMRLDTTLFGSAAAFRVFLAEKVDVAILEVGLGGRLDATNCVPQPVVCGISALGYDHMELLGNTLRVRTPRRLMTDAPFGQSLPSAFLQPAKQ